MLHFLWQKMWKNKWMMFCLFVGNLLLVSIVAATPLYINATMRRILHQDLRAHQLENEEHPAMISLSFIFNNASSDMRIQHYLDTLFDLAPNIPVELNIPVRRTIRTDIMSQWHLFHNPPREANPRPRPMNLTGAEGFFDYINIVQGRLPGTKLIDGHIIEGVISEATLLRNDMLLGDVLEVRNVAFDDGYYLVHIVGIYELKEGSDEFWTTVNIRHDMTHILISDYLLLSHFIFNYHSDYRIMTTWVHLLDYTAMSSRDVPHYLRIIEEQTERFGGGLRTIWNYQENFSATIAAHTERTDRLAVTLWVLQVPIYVLLAFYIYMVSRQILLLEQNDISVLKSRGASRKQILGLYAMQGLFISVIVFPLGMALGVFICNVLGASSGFLDLVSRTQLHVTITFDAVLYTLLALFVSFLTMFLPVIRFSKMGIVAHKRRKNGKLQKPIWQRFYLDILCLGIALYALYTFNQQRDVMAHMIRTNQSVDPLLFLSSSLFIMGLGLLCLRLFPHFIQRIFRIGKRFWKPAAYAAFIRVMRSAGEEQFIMIFLLFTLSVGTFSAQAARTINLNNDHQIKYLAGADLTFLELWRAERPPEISADGEPPPATANIQTVFFEPDFERFTHFDEVDAITRVQRQYVRMMPAVNIPAIERALLMGIDTDSFGRTAWFRDDLLGADIFYFLNALAIRADGILLSNNFREVHDVRLGDNVHFVDEFGNSARGVVVGFVDHFPGFSPVRTAERDGITELIEQNLIVANRGHLINQIGIQPYHVWMRTNTDSNRFFYEFINEHRIVLRTFNDTTAELIESRSDPILQGTNGILTVGFIVTLIICFTGFLIYWILSIRQRNLQFGIFRAMGMSMKSLIELLVNEQMFITLTAILLGALVGEITARLFVPLIQISYSAADQVIPLIIGTDLQDYANLYTVVGVMISICLIVLAIYVSKIKIAQALKLGED